jgi:restriction system protein
MAIPDFQSFFYPVLKYSSEHNEISLNEIREFLTQHFTLTDEEKAERVPSGAQTKFDNRIYWTKSYFSKAKLIENTKRSHFKITDRGRNFLANFSDYISINDLKTIGEFRDFNEGTTSTGEQNPTTTTTITETIPTIDTKTPLEKLEESYQFIKRELASELLEKIRSNTWQFFEDLVIDLMVKMGYGGSRNKAGESIKRTNDEGIDGIINEDKLGLDVIYLQAKMWKEETSIGRPEIQKFVGALHGQRAKKGVFITTSSFAKTAIEYVKSIDPKVILIDGETLTNLMIEYNVGVTGIETYQIKKIDLDYFEK